jgi:hypothetical protein
MDITFCRQIGLVRVAKDFSACLQCSSTYHSHARQFPGCLMGFWMIRGLERLSLADILHTPRWRGFDAVFALLFLGVALGAVVPVLGIVEDLRLFHTPDTLRGGLVLHRHAKRFIEIPQVSPPFRVSGQSHRSMSKPQVSPA